MNKDRDFFRKAVFWTVAVLMLAGCAGRQPAPVRPRAALLGFTIQAGAFAVLNNAVRLTESLQEKGQDATFFRDADGLYKVRFGSFADRDTARRQAGALQRAGIIGVYYIVAPVQQTAAQQPLRGEAYVRERIAQTARGFISLPYRWGGTSPETGFDCSGLTMTAYRLNGFDLPRTSREQFRNGQPIGKSRLAKGDLVFFAIAEKKTVSHVGLYLGNGRFVHAPGQGKTIRTDALSNSYYRRYYIGARSYL